MVYIVYSVWQQIAFYGRDHTITVPHLHLQLWPQNNSLICFGRNVKAASATHVEKSMWSQKISPARLPDVHVGCWYLTHAMLMQVLVSSGQRKKLQFLDNEFLKNFILVFARVLAGSYGVVVATKGVQAQASGWLQIWRRPLNIHRPPMKRPKKLWLAAGRGKVQSYLGFYQKRSKLPFQHFFLQR